MRSTVLLAAACLPLAVPVVVCVLALGPPLVALYVAYAVFFRRQIGPYADISF